MTISVPLRLKGAPGSPYTRKMLALLRYRHIPYEFLIGDQASRAGLPEPRVSLLPTFYLEDDQGEVQAVVDSTPLIRRFEEAFTDRRVVPPDPVMAFVDALVEDYADEWLTKAMFHYRWYYASDIDKAGTVLPRWRAIGAPEAELLKLKALFAERQISRLYVVGSNDVTAPVIEASYVRNLGILDDLLQRHPFVMGGRPGAGDFGIYAQLTQLAKFDPTPAAICLREAPRVFAWTDLVDDLSGTPAAEDAWLSRAQARDHLGPLLGEIGRVYAPFLLANAEALESGAEQVEATIDGKPWAQPPFPYQGKCLQGIRAGFAALSNGDRKAVAGILAGTGCEPLLGIDP